MALAPPTSFGWEAPGVTSVFVQGIATGDQPVPVASGAMTEPGGSGPNATTDALAGTRWEILTIDGQGVVGGGEPLVVAFGHDGRVSGTTGVNQLTASYSLTPEYLTFGPLATTRRAGPPELMEQEHRVVASLAGMCPFRLDARSLSIKGPLGWVELTNTNPPPEPEPPGPADGPPAD